MRLIARPLLLVVAVVFLSAAASLNLLGLFLYLATDAFAQAVGNAVDTKIQVGELLKPWLEMLIGGAASVMMAFFAFAAVKLRSLAGLQESKAADEAEKFARDALHSALQSAAGWLIATSEAKAGQITIDLKSAAIAEAVRRVNLGAYDAVQKFAIDPDTIARMVVEKVGVLTAPKPEATAVTGT